VLDPETIRGNATLENPNQLSSGIDLVTVGGRVAYRDGRVAGRNGAAVRYAASVLPLRAEQ
jgi:N-acyl-D-aspartate/D-glutamate deacylase